ncbi:MAG: dehydrogenase E1 component subunit alpha/beta, partial [bacterium]|nr:dehydrogenase E1 component subunit alpha/beta [bacterium]
MLSKEKLLRMYKIMYTSRLIDDTEIKFKKQGSSFFEINGCGHEALGAAIGAAIKPHDWVYPYYRDRALLLARGYSILDMMLDALGKEGERNSWGRQMPSHWSHEKTASCASPTGVQFLPAVGCAEASLYFEKYGIENHGHVQQEITLVTSGEGACSQGEFWEAINAACIMNLPLIFIVEDNSYAISVPASEQTPGMDVVKNLAAMTGLATYEVDGLDPIKSYDVISRAAERARHRNGPSLIRARVIRPYSHSVTDDATRYRPEAEIMEEILHDPVVSSADAYPLPRETREKIKSRGVKYGIFAEQLILMGVTSEQELLTLRHTVEEEVATAEEEAKKVPLANTSKVLRHLYSEDIDPTSESFNTPQEFQGEKITMADALTRTLDSEMKRNERMIILGEDVADASEEAITAGCKGKGGVFGITFGLGRKYGERVRNTPLAEASIVGRAVGLAARKLKPVVEIQFMDYVWPAFDQIRQQLASLRWRSCGKWSCPVVIRVCVGSAFGGGTAIWHSQCNESFFTHTPGLRVVFPSNAADVIGLLRTAIRCDDPVIFMEHKWLYRNEWAKTEYPGDDYTIPFGKAKIVREGTDITVITYGAMVYFAIKAAENLEKFGISAEIIDLRTLKPWDFETVARSFQKTNRALILQEDIEFSGFGA